MTPAFAAASGRPEYALDADAASCRGWADRIARQLERFRSLLVLKRTVLRWTSDGTFRPEEFLLTPLGLHRGGPIAASSASGRDPGNSPSADGAQEAWGSERPIPIESVAALRRDAVGAAAVPEAAAEAAGPPRARLPPDQRAGRGRGTLQTLLFLAGGEDGATAEGGRVERTERGRGAPRAAVRAQPSAPSAGATPPSRGRRMDRRRRGRGGAARGGLRAPHRGGRRGLLRGGALALPELYLARGPGLRRGPRAGDRRRGPGPAAFRGRVLLSAAHGVARLLAAAHAAAAGQAEIVRSWRGRGRARRPEADGGGDTALHLAVQFGRLECVQALAERQRRAGAGPTWRLGTVRG